jgi:hypothetical protein
MKSKEVKLNVVRCANFHPGTVFPLLPICIVGVLVEHKDRSFHESVSPTEFFQKGYGRLVKIRIGVQKCSRALVFNEKRRERVGKPASVQQDVVASRCGCFTTGSTSTSSTATAMSPSQIYLFLNIGTDRSDSS